MFYVSVSLEWNIENFRKKRQKVAVFLLPFGVFCNLFLSLKMFHVKTFKSGVDFVW